MKKTSNLIRLAESLQYKYASVDANTLKDQIRNDIYNDIKNAASAGNQGIMNFPQMIQEDGTTIRFDVFRNDSLGFKTIKVYNFEVNKPANAAKYAPMAEQVQSYLSKNHELFTFKHNGEDVVYNNFILNLTYAPEVKESPSMIAGD